MFQFQKTFHLNRFLIINSIFASLKKDLTCYIHLLIIRTSRSRIVSCAIRPTIRRSIIVTNIRIVGIDLVRRLLIVDIASFIGIGISIV